jgi:iron-sulfur cluster assembly protein
MLKISPTALAVIRQVTSHPRLTDTSGLRIAQRNRPGAPMRVGAVLEPQRGDTVLERDGGRIYVGPAAVQRLRGRLLDAFTAKDGRVHFVLRKE